MGKRGPAPGTRAEKYHGGRGNGATQAVKDEAFKLRLLGYSYEQISKTLGYGVSNIHKWVKDLIQETRVETGIELRKIEEARLDMLAMHATELMRHADPVVRLKAAAQLLRVEESRRRMLGIDEPDKHVIENAPTDEEQKLADMLAEYKKRVYEDLGRLKHGDQ